MTRQLLVCSLILILFAPLSCVGQASFTTVNATLVDGSAQVWANATVIASLRPAPNNPGLPLNNGLPITDSPQTVVADGTGAFTLILDDTSHITPAGATWIFNIYPNATVQNGSSITLAVTGTSQNFSGVLSSILITPAVFAAPSINRAYADSQVIGGTGGVYWNTVSNTLKGCTFAGPICTWATIGNVGIPGNHFYIPYNNGIGGFTASANFQFNDTTNTINSVNENLTGTLNVAFLAGNIAGTPTFTGNLFFSGLPSFNGGLKGTLASVNKYQTNAPSSPTCTFSSGGGTSPSCTVVSGSSDSQGSLTLITGTTASSAGNALLTFNTTYTSPNNTNCIFVQVNIQGLPNGVWDPRVGFSQINPLALSSAKFSWDNNSVNLTDSRQYHVNYFCWGN